MLLQAQWAAVGLNAKIEKVDSGVWWDRVPEGDYDAAPTWWYNETPDPDLALRWALCGSCGSKSLLYQLRQRQDQRADRSRRRRTRHREAGRDLPSGPGDHHQRGGADPALLSALRERLRQARQGPHDDAITRNGRWRTPRSSNSIASTLAGLRCRSRPGHFFVSGHVTHPRHPDPAAASGSGPDRNHSSSASCW